MALCDYHTISWIIFDLRESRLGLFFFFFSSGMRKNNDLLLFFYPPPLLLRSWRQQAFQSVSKCKAKAPGGTGPIFNLVEAQTRVNAPVALYRSIRTLGSPFERRNKSNMQQAYTMGADSGSYSIARNGRWESRHQMTSRRRRRRWGRNKQVKLYG